MFFPHMCAYSPKSELDSVLEILGNPIRRRIIKSLSREPDYALRLSRELQLDQQLVFKHLEVLERLGIVRCEAEPSPHGPPRKVYSLNKSVSVSLDFAPHLYSEAISSFSVLPPHTSRLAAGLRAELERVLEGRVGESIAGYSKLLAKIDERLRELREERLMLLYLRNAVMEQLSATLTRQGRSLDERRVIYEVLHTRNPDPHVISDELNIDEAFVVGVLERLKREL